MLKTCYKKLLGQLDDVRLLTFKFHILYRIADDVSKFVDFSYIDVSVYENFNVTIKKLTRMTSMRKICTMNEAVNL